MVVFALYVAASAAAIVISSIWAYESFNADQKYKVRDYFTGQVEPYTPTHFDRVLAAVLWGGSCLILCLIIGATLWANGIFN